MIGALASLAATLVAVGEATPSPMDDLALELTWSAPEGCPDLASERAEIRRRVGDVERPLGPEPIVAQGEIRLDASVGYVLSLQTRVGAITGERVLSGQDCHQLAEAAALVLALLINPKASAEPAPPPPPPPLPPPPPPPSPPPRPRSGLGGGVDAVLATGVLPGLAEGLAVRLFYGRGLALGAARLAGFLPQEKTAPVWPGATASFYRLELALEICAATPSGRRLGGALCLGGAVVRLHGASAGVATPGGATAYWVEGLLAPSGHVSLTSTTRLRLAAELRGLGSRPDFAILGLGSVYRPAALNLRGALGIEVLF